MLIQCQLDVVADTTARDCYKQEAEKLCEKLSLARQQQDALLTLHRKIQDFQELAVSSVFCLLGGRRGRTVQQLHSISCLGLEG